MQYFIDFTGCTKEQIENWLNKNSAPEFPNNPNWSIPVFTKSLFEEYKNPAISFSSVDCKIYTGYCEAKYLRKHDDKFTEIFAAKSYSIRDFYSGKPLLLKNGESLTLTQIVNKDNEWWDGCHDFIQWLFPTVTQSKHCDNAPILTKEDAVWLNENHKLVVEGVIQRFYNFINSQDMMVFNHNHLRMTRMIEFKSLLSSLLPNTAFNLNVFFDICLNNLPAEIMEFTDGKSAFHFNRETFNHWVKALNAEFE